MDDKNKLIRLKALHDRKHKVFLALSDLGLLALAFVTVAGWRFQGDHSVLFIRWDFAFPLLITLFSLYVFGAYDLSGQHRFRTLLLRYLLAVFVSFLLLLIISYLFALGREGLWGRGVLLGSLILYFILGAFNRTIFWKLIKREVLKKKYLVLISSNFFEAFNRDVQRTALAGSFDFLIDLKSENSDMSRVVGAWDDYTVQLADNYSKVILAPSGEFSSEVVKELLRGRVVGQDIEDLVDFYEVMFGKVPLFYLHEWLLISTPGFYLNQSPVRYRMKRLFDVLFAGILFVLTLPVVLIAGLFVRITSPGDVLFRQTRVGRGGEDFEIIKLRTMMADAEKSGAQWAQTNDPRVTPLGKFLRATRIDELPQLWNVLRGDMSMIGPRPERPEFTSMLEKELPFYSLRHSVLPGLTGWAQVLFPYGGSVEDAKDKLQFELYYIRNYSLWMDLRIVFQTIQVVMFGRGR
ncbi:MAG: exopolysaccharide biosynthesis polyprenyl glycosylphosphotransferase [Pseudobdellovibrionaceae bacterium]